MIARQAWFPVPEGSSVSRRGGIDSLPVNTPPVLFRIEAFRQPHSGLAWLGFGHVPAKSIIPSVNEPVVASRTELPYPGSVTLRNGRDPLHPPWPIQPLIASRAETPYPGASRYSFNRSNTLIQTASRVCASQVSPPPYPGSATYSYASVDAGFHPRPITYAKEPPRPYPAGSVWQSANNSLQTNGVYQPPLVARESPRPPPAGSAWAWHGGADNGLLYVSPLVVREFPSLPYPGLVRYSAGSVIPNIGTPILFEFTLDLTYTVNFTVDLASG